MNRLIFAAHVANNKMQQKSLRRASRFILYNRCVIYIGWNSSLSVAGRSVGLFRVFILCLQQIFRRYDFCVFLSYAFCLRHLLWHHLHFCHNHRYVLIYPQKRCQRARPLWIYPNLKRRNYHAVKRFIHFRNQRI